MGVSTDAVLFYGFCWGDREETLSGDDEWPVTVLKRRGVLDPRAACPDDLRQATSGPLFAEAERWFDAHRAELDAWYAAQRDVAREFGCQVGSHCSGDYPLPYVYVRGSRTLASRGYPVEVSTDRITISADGTSWDHLLADFLAALGVERPQPKPVWWLVSYWG